MELCDRFKEFLKGLRNDGAGKGPVKGGARPGEKTPLGIVQPVDPLALQILSMIPQAVVVLDEHYGVVAANQQLVDWLKVGLPEYLQAPEPLFFLDADGRDLVQEFFDCVLAKQASLRRLSFRCIAQAADELPVERAVSLCAVEQSQGRTQFILTLNHNAQPVDPVGGSSCDSAVRLLREFAGGAAHSINNCMTSLLGACSLLISAEGKLTAEQTHKLLYTIREAGEQAADVARELMNFVRKSVTLLRRHPISVIEVVEQSLKVAKGFEAAAGINFTLNYTPCSFALADEQGLEQVLINLLCNAIDAMEGQGEIQMEVKPVNSGGREQVVLMVKDQGKGLADDLQQKVFAPFYSTKRKSGKKQLGGNGLGLSTAAALVENWGGNLYLSSEVGRGTTIRICLASAGVSAGLEP